MSPDNTVGPTDAARLQDIIEVVIAIASNDFTRRAFVGDGQHELDGLASGVNMLAEEVARQFHRQREFHQQLAQAERLAAIGRIATSVAHEVNNPAAVIAANLAALDRFFDTVQPWQPPSATDLAEARAITRDSLEGVQRIASIMRDLQAAGRSADTTTESTPPSRDVAPIARAEGTQVPVATVPGRARVLLIDDEPLLLSALKRLLMTDFDLGTAGGGAEAIALLEQDDAWDGVLCDLTMPLVDGPAVHAWVEANRPALEPRLLFFSGGAFTERGERFAARIGERLLRKPLRTADVRAALGRVLARQTEPTVARNTAPSPSRV
jgi:CheY-like chemotaxis protein